MKDVIRIRLFWGESKMHYQRLTRIWAYLLLVVMLFFFYYSYSLKCNTYYLRSVIISVIFLDLIVIFLSFKQQNNSSLESQTKAYVKLLDKKTMVIIVAPLLNYILWDYIYFLGGSFITMFALFVVQKVPVLKASFVAILTAIAVQLLFFNVFQVRLPSPSWWPNW